MRNDDAPRNRPPAHATPGEPADRATLAALFGEVQTERLTLRRVQPDDGLALFAIDGDPATHLHNPAGPARSLADADERLREWVRRWEVDGFGYWAIARSTPTASSTSPGVIGFGGVQRIHWRERDVLNLYYRFTPSAWGQGYAAEMARMAVTLARAHLAPWPVVARTRPANIASIGAAESAGLSRRPELDAADETILALGWGA